MGPRSWQNEKKRPFADKYFLEQFRQARLASSLYMALGINLFILKLPAFMKNKKIHGVLPFPWKRSDMARSRPIKQQLERSTTLPYDESFYAMRQDMLKPMFS